jgi:N-acetylmuramoyl-L-alanine amidase
MPRTILFSLCVFLCSILALRAQMTVRYTVVLPDGKRMPLSVYRLNDRDYVSMESLTRSMFRGATLVAGGNEIRWKDKSLRSVPSSFYLLYGNSEGTRIAQMPYPSLDIARSTCLPLFPLCSSLETLGVYTVDIQGNTIMLKYPSGRQPVAILFPGQTPEPEPRVAVKSAPRREQIELPEEPEPDVITGLNTGIAAPSVLEDVGAALAPFKAAASGVGSRAPSQPTIVPQVPVSVKPTPVPQPAGKRPAHQNSEEELPANRYILPPGLYRREVIEADTMGADSLRSFFEDDRQPQAGPPMASLTPLPLATFLPATTPEPGKKVEVISMDITVEDGAVGITLTGNTSIDSYQRPEYKGRQLVLRISDAKNAIPTATLRRLGDMAPVTAVRVEHVGDMLVYRLTFSRDIEKCLYTRKSSRVVKFTAMTPTGAAVYKPSAEAKRWELDVIVLDAGHGGKDVGAIGVSGNYEKDVTLALVKKLGALIEENMPGTKVVYTRHDDRFVELYRRGQIANEAGGKLFVSIHCNSMPTKPSPANGFETYILRPGRNEDAVRVAERENGAIKFEKNQKRYKELNDEQFIVVNMAQSAFVKFSEMFASTVQQEIAKATPLASRGVNQAGFYVLVGASMPNILFESAFLSNADDEKYITSNRGQDAVARGLFNAIRVYAEQYEQLIRAQK